MNRGEILLPLSHSERWLIGYLISVVSEAIFRDEWTTGRNEVPVTLELNLGERADLESLRQKLQRAGPKVRAK